MSVSVNYMYDMRAEKRHEDILMILKRILENQIQIKQDIYRLMYASNCCPNESTYNENRERDIGMLKDINETLGIEN